MGDTLRNAPERGFVVRMVHEDGRAGAYTGKAGKAFFAPLTERTAFVYIARKEAEQRANMTNSMTNLHGYRAVVITSEQHAEHVSDAIRAQNELRLKVHGPDKWDDIGEESPRVLQNEYRVKVRKEVRKAFGNTGLVHYGGPDGECGNFFKYSHMDNNATPIYKCRCGATIAMGFHRGKLTLFV